RCLSVLSACWCLVGTLLVCGLAGAVVAAQDANISGPDQKTAMANGHLGDCRSCHGKPDSHRFMAGSPRSRVVFQVDCSGCGPAVGEVRGIEGAFWFDPNNTAKVS